MTAARIPKATLYGVGASAPRRCERGAALIELALCLPIVLLVFAGLTDYALFIQQAMLVTQAASAGAAYGAIPGNQNDLTGIQTAAQNAVSGVSSFAVTATDVYTCTPGGASVASSTTCSGYGTPIKYVQVETSATVHPLLTFPGLPSTLNLKGAAYFRVPWTP